MIASSPFVPSTSDVFDQARSGSITAIIQVLNEHLAEAGVRTRAMGEGGMLQILCEASHRQQLLEGNLAPQIQQILNEISPWGISRARIYCRIVQEQKLLWLKEVKDEPESLLWTKDIRLNPPPLAHRVWGDWVRSREKSKQRALSRLREGGKKTRNFNWAVVASLVAAIAAGSVALLSFVLWSGRELPTVSLQAASSQPEPVAKLDPFAEAVRIAEQAGKDGKVASTSAEWLDLAARWQKASDYMAQVGEDDERYGAAQERVASYKNNSDAALGKAGKR
ncbi:MAG: hypothetical protein HC824_15465 [Synechococcales cyanobacterium RM1_1_8]|nr:hypothetical protein [Synechococcales cyanobacterium RM1_1_8]